MACYRCQCTGVPVKAGRKSGEAQRERREEVSVRQGGVKGGEEGDGRWGDCAVGGGLATNHGGRDRDGHSHRRGGP